MSSAFKQRATTRKGAAGEEICFDYLRRKGHTIYRPDDTGRRHPIDSLVLHGEKLTLIAADVKTKPRRQKYPDTGINIKHYGEYCCIQKVNGIRVFLFFVDEDLLKIYGNFLNVLDEKRKIFHEGRWLTYPILDRGIIYFPLDAMIDIARLPAEEVEPLKALNGSKYKHQQNDIQLSLDMPPTLNPVL